MGDRKKKKKKQIIQVIFSVKFTVSFFHLRRRRYDSVQKEVGAFDRYQITLLLVTQLANCAVAGSMLCTIYDMTPPKLVQCMDDLDSSPATVNLTTMSLCVCKNSTFTIDFHSLLLDLFLYW